MNSAGKARTAPVTTGDSLAFGTIFVTAFVVLLCIALAAQLLTLSWRTWLPGAESERSLFGGVKAAVHTFMPLLP